MAAQELRWLTYLLTDLGEQPRSPPVLYVDNKAMIALCQEHRLEHRTKHIALRYFLARELHQRGQLRLAYGFTEMVKAMCTYQHQQQLMFIHASPWIGISCDESTDRSRGKHLVGFATFMKERSVVTEFLALLTVHKCDAGSLFAVLLSYLDNIGIDLQRIVAVSTDGAGVMIGSQSGLVVCLRQRVPHLVGTHCIAHR
ncbi:unnamed protein product [Closterium sp. NIES-54]